MPQAITLEITLQGIVHSTSPYCRLSYSTATYRYFYIFQDFHIFQLWVVQK